ncbi:adenylate/guanylate cyclase domain-containing protein [Pyxidicoccus parkwayensis]|uniref:Adenylate/guanylate cyclase domain-containing protein n=1 Tax=Pyxidicoccus parkwayensis TaxID=2813578 RepID=A0ABX7NSM5_9BACT|nr:adenylate/guanylate cyclase domain-containing protein [Pyxidicoccus parkwaysis]QSQ20401.1 adenylate/guanylate cyclase domain-containing protein [Pyxidicoccus parkwaysis]
MVMEAPEPRKLSAILFTGIEGPGRDSWRDDALQQLLRDEHASLVRELLPRHGGREVKRLEDGFLLEFEGGPAAVDFGLELHCTLAARNGGVGAERRMVLRVGVHLGMVVHRDGDVFGEGVNLAARIEALARPGTLYVSETVARQVEGRLPKPPVRLGRGEMKNIRLPVAVYRIDPPERRNRVTLFSRMRSLLGRGEPAN